MQLFETVPNHIMDAIFDIDLSIKSEGVHDDVSPLLERTVLVGGKRIRPLLTMLMGGLFNVSVEKLKPYARMIELLHAASLSHDDVIDNATIRRSQPSINIISSNKKAVLAGDFLFADVIVSAAREGNLKLVEEIALVIQALSDGEWLQLDLAETKDVTREQVELIALKKTSSVMSWCCIVGAYLSESSSELTLKARDFGKNLGIAFQLIDDTFDFKIDSEKDYLLDLENGVINAVMTEWFLDSPEELKKLKSGEEVNTDFESPEFKSAIKKVKSQAHDHLKKAKKLLDEMVEFLEKEKKCDLDNYKKPLVMILDYLENRES